MYAALILLCWDTSVSQLALCCLLSSLSFSLHSPRPIKSHVSAFTDYICRCLLPFLISDPFHPMQRQRFTTTTTTTPTSKAPRFLSAPPCPLRHVSPVPPSSLPPPLHQDCSCISHAQVQPMDIEERYEDTSHQFLVSSQDTVSMETGVTLMLFHHIVTIHLLLNSSNGAATGKALWLLRLEPLCHFSTA